MMAGADEPATLSGLCQPMAIAMVTVVRSQSRIDVWRRRYLPGLLLLCRRRRRWKSSCGRPFDGSKDTLWQRRGVVPVGWQAGAQVGG